MSKLVPFLAVFAGLILCAIVVPSAVDTLSVALDFDEFVEVRAVATSTRTQNHQRGPATGIVEFEFTTPDGQTIRGDNSLTRLTDSPELVDQLVEREKGVDRVTVFYDAGDPRRAVIHEVSIWSPLGLIGLSLLLLVGGVHAWIIDVRRRRLQARADAARRHS